ncbi:hypothetical protein l11_17580 [Neisseria weaveri LMG 5135]|nr:hypothetical protein l11_17580 [Neisseria weaveri LMG 5135]EGV38526.1 hypothetical protein l13_00590 [Neisseria weaveri ATCC 51223]
MVNSLYEKFDFGRLLRLKRIQNGRKMSCGLTHIIIIGMGKPVF